MHFILIVGDGEFVSRSSIALRLCSIWQGRGHRISGATQSNPVNGDCALLHIDATTIDPAILLNFDPAMPVLNGRALDISKRVVSRNIVSPEDDYEGEVILKTDANAFGIPAYPLTAEHRQRVRLRATVNPRNWLELRELPVGTYPILHHKKHVPHWAWSREDIVIEKFLPEKEDGLFVLRLWMFLGRREVALKLYSHEAVVKSGEIVRYEYIDDVPQELRDERERLGFDFGKFDYVMYEGRAVLLDANKTPTLRNPQTTPEYVMTLAGAIDDMISGASK